MADIKSSGERSPNMVAIHGKNTKSEVYIYTQNTFCTMLSISKESCEDTGTSRYLSAKLSDSYLYAWMLLA